MLDMRGFEWHQRDAYTWWLTNYEGRVVGKVTNFISAGVIVTLTNSDVSETFLSEEKAKAWLLSQAKNK